MDDNVTRREFIAALAAGAFARSRALAEDCTELSCKMKVRRYSVPVGASAPFTVLHISDTHISFADIIDGVPHPRNAAGRARCFPHANDALKASLAYARKHDEMVVHTGDLIDYVNEKNLAAARMWTSASRGGIIVAGNHEYCQMVGDGKTEDESYKAETRSRVQAAYPDNLLFSSRVVNGINFISLDNVYYYVPAGVPEMFEAEAARGLPIVVCCHVPFYTPEIYKAVTQGDMTRPPYLCGVPDAMVDRVKDPKRRKQQRADARTHEFVARLRGEKLVKAVLCGHLHWPHVYDFAPGVPQYCVGANFHYEAFELEFC